MQAREDSGSDIGIDDNNNASSSRRIYGRPYFPRLNVDVPPIIGSGDSTVVGDALEQQLKSVVAAVLEVNGDNSGTSNSSSDAWTVERVSGGITNQLFRMVLHGSTGTLPTSVLVRIFGAHGMIDRDIETASYAELAAASLAPPYYGRFGNGRIEGWCEGMRPLQVDELRKPEVRQTIAGELARLHGTFRPSDALSEHHPSDQPSLWKQLQEWCDQSLAATFTNPDQMAQLQSLDLSSMPTELEWVKDIVPPDSALVFCHNDLLAANVLYDDSSGQIQFIDFEYGGMNYAAFDIANHWNEYAGGPPHSSEPNYDWFPAEEDQLEFVQCYLQSLGGPEHTPGSELEQGKVLQLFQDVQTFVLANHLYWGLWAVNQAASEGCEQYDYLTYAQRRLQQYQTGKKEWLE